MEKLTARTIRRWREECADGVHLRGMIFKAEWEALCDLALKGLAAPAPEVVTTEDRIDAVRYRWLRQSNCRDGVPFIAIFDGRLSQWTGKFADEQVDAAMSSSLPQGDRS